MFSWEKRKKNLKVNLQIPPRGKAAGQNNLVMYGEILFSCMRGNIFPISEEEIVLLYMRKYIPVCKEEIFQ
jgi:hypothetical protein